MPNLEIDVEMDKVTVEHQVIKRPERISRSDWYRYWESINPQPSRLQQCYTCDKITWIG